MRIGKQGIMRSMNKLRNSFIWIASEVGDGPSHIGELNGPVIAASPEEAFAQWGPKHLPNDADYRATPDERLVKKVLVIELPAPKEVQVVDLDEITKTDWNGCLRPRA